MSKRLQSTSPQCHNIYGTLPTQQTGLNILLKKAYKQGALARAAGRSPLAAVADAGAGNAPSAAAAEANMAALLEELELEEEGWVLGSGGVRSGNRTQNQHHKFELGAGASCARWIGYDVQCQA